MKVRFFVIALAIVGLFAVLSVAFDQTSDSQTNDVFAASELEVGEDGESAGIVPCILCGPIPTFPPRVRLHHPQQLSDSHTNSHTNRPPRVRLHHPQQLSHTHTNYAGRTADSN